MDSLTLMVGARAAVIPDGTFFVKWGLPAPHDHARPVRRKSHTAVVVTPMNIRLYAALVIIGLLAVFALQNSSQLTVHLFFWSFQIPQALLIVSCGAVGLLIGWLLGASGKKSAK